MRYHSSGIKVWKLTLCQYYVLSVPRNGLRVELSSGLGDWDFRLKEKELPASYCIRCSRSGGIEIMLHIENQLIRCRCGLKVCMWWVV